MKLNTKIVILLKIVILYPNLKTLQVSTSYSEIIYYKIKFIEFLQEI